MTTVLMSPALNQGEPVPTVEMLVRSLPGTVTHWDFNWRRAFLSHYDVLHLHWPEALLRSHSRFRAAIKPLVVAALLVRLRFTRIPVFWTVHNETPHEPGTRTERLLLRLLQGAVTDRIYLYASGVPDPVPPGARVVPRGDYRPLYGGRIEGARQASRPPSSLLLFGLLRPYKGIEVLLSAFAGLDGSRSLTIAGSPITAEYGTALARAAEAVGSVDLQLGHLEDDRLADRIEAADVVVLPYHRMYNSGAALLALDFGRPIIVPQSPTMLELQAEVGAEWVHTYDGALDSETLEGLLKAIESAPRDRLPLFRDRDWPAVGARYAAAYQEALERRSRRRSPAREVVNAGE